MLSKWTFLQAFFATRFLTAREMKFLLSLINVSSPNYKACPGVFGGALKY